MSTAETGTPPPSERRRLTLSGTEYDEYFDARARGGQDVHGEASFVESLGARTVLDAGCGTGRVAIELARRGLDVVGVDVDAGLLARARQKAPHLTWILADLVDVTLPAVPAADAGAGSSTPHPPGAGGAATPRRFDCVVLAGNVLIFLARGTEAAAVANMARHLAPGGRLVAGFQLVPDGPSAAEYEGMCAAAGLLAEARYATWERAPWAAGGDYLLAVHSLPAASAG